MKRRRGAGRVFATVVALVAVSYPLLAAVRAGAAPTRLTLPARPLTAPQLFAALRAGAWLTRVPADLQPPLADAGSASPGVSTNGCRLGRAGVWKRPCVYGDTASHTTVVLFGDSHAAMWFPALELISKQRHWRLVDLTKSGCPPVEVGIAAWFLGGASYSACPRWRAEAMAYITRLRPSLVIATWARWLEAPEALALAGVPATYGNPWLDGVATMFSLLRRAARHVIFISDVPTLPQSAPACLSAHESAVQACIPSRSAATALPAIKTAELDLANRERIDPIDPTPWFCTTARCPLIVHDLLVYQDNSHMTRQWSQFISPVLADAILPLLRRGSRGAAIGSRDSPTNRMEG